MKTGRLSTAHSGIVMMILLCVAIIGPAAQAIEIGQDVNLTGTMRWRGELDDRDFVESTALNELQYLRTRLELDITSIERAQIYFQIQISFLM